MTASVASEVEVEQVEGLLGRGDVVVDLLGSGRSVGGVGAPGSRTEARRIRPTSGQACRVVEERMNAMVS